MTDDWVLFISHDASRTGAPILLLNLLRWLKEHTDLRFEVLLRSGGPLQPDFEAVAPTWLDTAPRIARGRAGDAVRRLRHDRLVRRRPRLIYSNTITNGSLLFDLRRAGCPVISHVHELDRIIDSHGADNFAFVSRLSTKIIVCAHAVADSLVRRGIARERIEVVHEFIPIPAPKDHDRGKLRDSLLRELGIPSDAIIIGGAGTLEWRKAPEIFVLLAREVLSRRADPRVHFLWLGGRAPSGPGPTELLFDVQRLGLTGRVHFVGAKPNPLDYFALLDIFALVSREDPYPLVCLEAASLGTPVLCFDQSGGMPEFVERDAGFVVPYLDVAAMADAGLKLIESESLRRTMGDSAATKVRSRHDVAVAGARIFDIIRSQL